MLSQTLKSGFTLDASGYNPGRELTTINIYDPVEYVWYTIETFGGGLSDKVFIDVKKRATQGRIWVDYEPKS